jgi:hypothetical protein
MKQKNVIMDGARGKLGQSVFKVTKDGRTIIGKAPKERETPPTEDQQAAQDRFTDASAFAKGQMTNPERKAAYAAKVTPKLPSAYAVAMADALKPPKVKEIDSFAYRGVVGNPIRIKAVDDFKVVSVEVEIRKADGTIVESGNAVQDVMNIQMWNYAATVANPTLAGTTILARAKDWPDNVGEFAIAL